MANHEAFLTPEQSQLLRRCKCADFSEEQFREFLYAVNRFQLDPFANQVHAVLRNKKQGDSYVKAVTIQTGIDGYRLIADRTGQYAGSDDAKHDIEGASAKQPGKSTVTVYKLVGGVRCPFTATARWGEYFPGDRQGAMWKKMPFVMLDKCAEALALRKAFPNELSGLYTHEEMQQADAERLPKPGAKPPQENKQPTKPTLLLPDVRDQIIAAVTVKDLSPIVAVVNARFSGEDLKQLTRDYRTQMEANTLAAIANVTEETVDKLREHIAKWPDFDGGQRVLLNGELDKQLSAPAM